MKPPVALEPSRIRHSSVRKHAPRPLRKIRRECIALSDPTDCLLDAYDCVARRAYENFQAQGPRPGGELDDWLNAERELLLGFVINVEVTDDFIYALASVPGATADCLVVGIESRWLVILARPACESHVARRIAPVDATTRAALRTVIAAGPEPRASDSMPSAKSVCVLELPADVDAPRSIAVLCDGLLGIRMPRTISRAATGS